MSSARRSAVRYLSRLCTFAGALGLLATAPAGAAEHLVPLEWTASGTFDRTVTVAPAKFVEVCGRLAVGDRISWRFEGNRPSDFNIHYHEGQAVRYPAKEQGSIRSEGTLEVASTQDYCWMWTNRSAAPLDLRVHLQRSK